MSLNLSPLNFHGVKKKNKKKVLKRKLFKSNEVVASKMAKATDIPLQNLTIKKCSSK